MNAFKYFPCQACGELLEAGTEWAGKTIQCPACSQTTDVIFPNEISVPENQTAQKGITVSRIVFNIFVGLLSLVIIVCVYFLISYKSIGETHRAERDEARSTITQMTRDKAMAEKTISEVKAALEQLQAENRRLKQTARFYFDQAIEAMKAADRADNNQADRAAISQFQEVTRRFPEDPLTKAAQQKTAELWKRIAGREADVKRAQGAVLRLVQQCRNEAVAAKHIHDQYPLRFNAFNEIDLNTALAGSREAEPHDKAVRAAKEKAEELLRKEVPDPDGTLAKQIEGCDNL